MSRPESTVVAAEAQPTDQDRIEAIARVVGGWAHHFNEILTVILAKADLFAEGLPDDLPRLRADIDDLRRAARRGADTTEKLLAFASGQALELETVDLGEVVEDMRRTLLRVLPPGIDLRIVIPANEDLRVTANAPAVQQILLGLVTNARDAMPEGGTLTVTLARTARAAGAIRLLVDDTGPGLDPSIAERVFEPFFTTKNQGRGNGLGLPLVHGLVRRHGGHVSIRSTPGLGTTMEVEFPSRCEPRRVVVLSSTNPSDRRVSPVLVAEDDDGVRHSIKSILEGLGHPVLQAGDGVEALGWLDEYGDEIDLVVADIAMPRMDGLDLYRAARDRGRIKAFLFTSGLENPRIDELVDSDPTLAFLAKPWSVPEFISKVEGMLTGVPIDEPR